MKLCVDCSFHEKSYLSSKKNNFDLCLRPMPTKLSLVTGKPITNVRTEFAEIQRSYACGTNARFFEQKKTFWMKIFK